MSNKPHSNSASANRNNPKAKRRKAGAFGKSGLKNLKPGLAPRLIAARIVQAVRWKNLPLDGLLEDEEIGFAKLRPEEKALARAIASTTLRHLGELNLAIRENLKKPPHKAPFVMPVLLTGAAQLLNMNVADHAAISLSVDAAGSDRDAKHFKPLINGVLRAVQRNRENVKPKPNLNVPEWLLKRLRTDYGVERAERIIVAQQVEAPIDLTVKEDQEGWATRLSGETVGKSGIRLPQTPQIATLNGFEEGAWWVQDAAAAVPAELLLNAFENQNLAGKRVLDACAAPGGKSAQLAAAGADVTSIDLSPARIDRLRENMGRLDLKAEIIVGDFLDLPDDDRFDGILLDAPCSATGTIRRHPDVPWLKSEKQISELAELQRKMLKKAATLLKPNGVMIFCTCSLLKEEGEAHLEFVESELPLRLMRLDQSEVFLNGPLTVCDGIFRSTPDIPPGMDGFFAMRLARA